MANKNDVFEKVQMTQPQRSTFDLTHDVKLSMNFGYLYPTWCRVCMPGDRITVRQEAQIRALPLVAPIMHRINVSSHTYFIPMRLLWAKWGKWATNTKVGGALPAHPYINLISNGSNYTKLMDYFGLPQAGLPPFNTKNELVNAMPFAAYQMIYQEYYRDQNLVSEVFPSENEPLVDGNNVANESWLTQLRKRAWKHDYFTSCLPFAQKGDVVDMPLNFQDVPIRRDQNTLTQISAIAGGQVDIIGLPTASTLVGSADLYADTSLLAGSTSINDLRTAEALQRWLERAARGGSRYTEWILSMYGVRSSDARLQRPEYVNGSVTPLLITDIPQTSDNASGTSPQGTLAGYGIANLNSRQSSYFCEEFGIMMTIMSIMPETAYQQGIEKSTWLRINDPSELPNPLFAQLGEQEVKVREITAYGDGSDDLFGYLPRFAEDRFENNRVCGDMKQNLNFWHLGRDFANEPALNQTFIECEPSYRSFAVVDPGVDHFVGHVLNIIQAERPLPKYNNPTLA